MYLYPYNMRVASRVTLLCIRRKGGLSNDSERISESIISPCRYREMIYGEDCEKLSLQRIGEILGISQLPERWDQGH